MFQYFTGNRDRNSLKQHRLFPVARARFIRFIPRGWYKWISMRAEVYGCPAGNNVFPVLIYKFHWKFPLLKEHSTLLNPLRSGSANCASKISPWICHAGILGTPSYTLLDSKFQTTFFCFIFHRPLYPSTWLGGQTYHGWCFQCFNILQPPLSTLAW